MFAHEAPIEELLGTLDLRERSARLLPRWTLDPSRCEVAFFARRMGATWVNGHFTGLRGELYLDWQNPLDSMCIGELDVCNLLIGEPYLNTQLRTNDFLGDSRSTISFRTHVTEHVEERRFAAGVELTLPGCTRAIATEVRYRGPWEEPADDGALVQRIGLRAQGEIPTEDFVVRGDGTRERGGRGAGNLISIAVDLQAVRDAH